MTNAVDSLSGFMQLFFYAGAAGRTAAELTSSLKDNKQRESVSFPHLCLIMLGIPRAAVVGVCGLSLHPREQ